MDSYERQTMLRIVGRALRMADPLNGKVVWARPITAAEIRPGAITTEKIVAGSAQS